MMGCFVVDGAEHVAVAVAAARVVPGFEPVEDGGGELGSGLPVVLVEELELEGSKEALGDAVIEAVIPAGSWVPVERLSTCHS